MVLWLIYDLYIWICVFDGAPNWMPVDALVPDTYTSTHNTRIQIHKLPQTLENGGKFIKWRQNDSKMATKWDLSEYVESISENICI